MLVGILWEIRSGTFLDHRLVALDQFLEVVCSQFIVLLGADFLAEFFEGFLKGAVLIFTAGLYTHDDVAVHLDEATVAIVGKSFVAGFFCQSHHCAVIQAKVENRVHHAGHGFACAGTNGEKQGLFFSAQLFAQLFFNCSDRCCHFAGECFRVFTTILVEVCADFCRDGETGRHGKADASHLGKVRTLASK